MSGNRTDSLRSDRAASPERVRSRSPVARDDDDEPFSPVVRKKSGKGKKRAARQRLEESRGVAS